MLVQMLLQMLLQMLVGAHRLSAAYLAQHIEMVKSTSLLLITRHTALITNCALDQIGDFKATVPFYFSFIERRSDAVKCIGVRVCTPLEREVLEADCCQFVTTPFSELADPAWSSLPTIGHTTETY